MMKRTLKLLVIAFVFLALGACAGLPGGPADLRARGGVIAYEAGKMIQLRGDMQESKMEGGTWVATPKNAPEATWVYVITPATVVKGDIQVGTRVLIHYTRTGSGTGAQMTAVSIERIWK